MGKGHQLVESGFLVVIIDALRAVALGEGDVALRPRGDLCRCWGIKCRVVVTVRWNPIGLFLALMTAAMTNGPVGVG